MAAISESAAFEAAILNLGPPIVLAREQWVLAVRAYEQLRATPDWDAQRRRVELVVYLTSLDYELKLMLQRFHQDVDNRAMWERLLALEVVEAVRGVPKRLGVLLKASGASVAERTPYMKASQRFSETAREAQSEKPIWEMITRMRNEVTAHHGGRGEDPFLAHVAWASASEQNRAAGTPSHRSLISQHAVSIGSAVQDIGVMLSNELPS